MTPALVFLGAGIGGLARYAIGGWVQGATGAAFPWGTLLVNVTGSLLLTLSIGVMEQTATSVEWRTFMAIGVWGGYTTFSTFSYETVKYLQDGEWARALAYVLATVLLTLIAAVAGFRLASLFIQRG